jgi:hypothetical protein
VSPGSRSRLSHGTVHPAGGSIDWSLVARQQTNERKSVERDTHLSRAPALSPHHHDPSPGGLLAWPAPRRTGRAGKASTTPLFALRSVAGVSRGMGKEQAKQAGKRPNKRATALLLPCSRSTTGEGQEGRVTLTLTTHRAQAVRSASAAGRRSTLGAGGGTGATTPTHTRPTRPRGHVALTTGTTTATPARARHSRISLGRIGRRALRQILTIGTGVFLL